MKTIPGFPNYTITRRGDVWSNKRLDACGRTRGGLWLKPARLSSGYQTVVLHINDYHKQRYIHRLVTLTYLTPVEGENQINHKNGNKQDNRVCNLEWCTAKENSVHRATVLEIGRGQDNAGSKLTEFEVLQIRRLYTTGSWSHKSLGERFVVTASAIGLIINRKNWKHT